MSGSDPISWCAPTTAQELPESTPDSVAVERAPAEVAAFIHDEYERGHYGSVMRTLETLGDDTLGRLLTGGAFSDASESGASARSTDAGLTKPEVTQLFEHITALIHTGDIDGELYGRILVAYATGPGTSFSTKQAMQLMQLLASGGVAPWIFRGYADLFEQHCKLSPVQIDEALNVKAWQKPDKPAPAKLMDAMAAMLVPNHRPPEPSPNPRDMPVNTLFAMSKGQQRDMREFNEKGGLIEQGEMPHSDIGGGYLHDDQGGRVLLPPATTASSKRLFHVLSHELGHAKDPDKANRDVSAPKAELTRRILVNEGYAVFNELRHEREVRAAGGPDITAETYGLWNSRMQATYDQHLQEVKREAPPEQLEKTAFKMGWDYYSSISDSDAALVLDVEEAQMAAGHTECGEED